MSRDVGQQRKKRSRDTTPSFVLCNVNAGEGRRHPCRRQRISAGEIRGAEMCLWVGGMRGERG